MRREHDAVGRRERPFDLLNHDDGTEVLRRYFERYAGIARALETGLVLETPTWRANPDWGAKLGYDALTLGDANRRAVGLLLEIRAAHETRGTPIVISGNLEPHWVAELEQFGVTALVRKPFEPERVAELLRSLPEEDYQEPEAG